MVRARRSSVSPDEASLRLENHEARRCRGRQRSISDNSTSAGGIEMQLRVFGRTGMQVSVLGFGCGAVGGLMVRGDPADQERTVARAISAGVNYFDTAVQYGEGESEKNLGRILQKLKPADAVVGTKGRLQADQYGKDADAVAASLENSLARLQLERVDIFHLHNPI